MPLSVFYNLCTYTLYLYLSTHAYGLILKVRDDISPVPTRVRLPRPFRRKSFSDIRLLYNCTCLQIDMFRHTSKNLSTSINCKHIIRLVQLNGSQYIKRRMILLFWYINNVREVVPPPHHDRDFF